MRVIEKYFLFIIGIVFATYTVQAQTPASAVWNLTSDLSATVTGNIVAPNQLLMNMQSQFVGGVQRTSPTPAAGTWPAETIENPSRYMEFSTSPIPGNAIMVTSVSLFLYASGGSNMKANVYFSKDPAFTNRTQIGTTFSLTQSAAGTPNVSAAPNLTISSDEAIYVRVYPWYTTAASGKYVIAKTATLLGTATPMVALTPSVLTLSNFKQVIGVPSTSKTYTLSGSNLTNSVTVSAPANFEISTDNGSSWNTPGNPITLLQSGGGIVGQPVTVSVRLNSLSTGTHSGDILHQSVGTPESMVLCSGTTLPQEPTVSSSLVINDVAGTSMTATMSGGNGSRRILLVRKEGPVNWLPEDGQPVIGVNSNFSVAGDQGNGTKCVYDGQANNAHITGLSPNTAYHFSVVEYNQSGNNTQNYFTASYGTANQTTLTMPGLQTSVAAISFGNAIINRDTIKRSIDISGTYLNSGSVVSLQTTGIFSISLNETAGFSSSLEIGVSGQTLPLTRVYVRFIPTELMDYSGALTISGGGAQSQNVSLTGKGVSAIVDFNAVVGFASIGGGATGGAGGTVVYTATGQQIADIMRQRENRSNAPLIIYITSVLTDMTTKISVKRTNNVSIIGIGGNAGLLGFGMKIVESKNIIVRNLTFADCKVDEKDALSIEQSSNVWVDHCTFTDSPSFDPEGNDHDGLLDVKNGSFNVTISYNYFTNHRKTCLLGHTSGQSSDTAMKVTYYRNWFKSTYSRHPRIRYGKVHLLNNLYTNVGILGGDAGGYAVGITCLTSTLLESNYFEGTPKPVLISQVNDPGGTLSGDPAGYIKSVNNFTFNSGPIVENLSGYSFNPNDYYSYDVVEPSSVKSLVEQNAGAGIIPTKIQGEELSTAPVDFAVIQNYPNPFNPSTTIQFAVSKSGFTHIKIYNLLGKEVATVYEGHAEQGKQYHLQFNAATLPSGMYICHLQNSNQNIVRKMTLLK